MSTEDCPAKMFDIKRQFTVHSFTEMKKSCFTIDICPTANIVTMGDITGRVLFQNYATNHDNVTGELMEKVPPCLDMEQAVHMKKVTN